MQQDVILVFDLGSEENPKIAREIRALGVYSEIHGDYVYENRKSSEAYFRAFYVEDGQLRCHRYPAKFYMKYPYRPGLEFDWDQLNKNFHDNFVGYGELWLYNGDWMRLNKAPERITNTEIDNLFKDE